MKIIYLIFVILLIIISQTVFAGEIKKDLVKEIAKKLPNEKVKVIVHFNKKPILSDINNLKLDGAKVKHQYKIIDAVAVEIPAKAAEKIAKRQSVKLVEPDYQVKLVLDSSTKQINANYAWQSNITGKGIDVAVLDTGISNNKDLSVVKSVDFTGEGATDFNGHGTHVAGIIASKNQVYKGVAPDANLINVKVLNRYGVGYSSDIIKGLEWAVDNSAEIISMSLGASIIPCDGTDAMSLAVDTTVSKGAVVVVAAGNSGPNYGTINSPGCSKGALTVGAVDDYDNIASFSSRGPTSDGRVKPDIVAPGVGITSTWNDGSFKSLSGTSMATPHISGVAALLLQANTGSNVKEVLKSNTINLGLDYNTQGSGRVDVNSSIIPMIKKANVMISEFSSDKYTINVSNNFTINLILNNSGDINAEGVSAKITLPVGLTTNDLTKNIGIINPGSEATTNWLINTLKEGSYNIMVDFVSSNDGSGSKNLSVKVQVSEQQNQTKLPPGISKKNSLPKGIARKQVSISSFSNNILRNLFNNLPVLSKVYEQVQEKAKPSIQKAINKQVQKETTIKRIADKKKEFNKTNSEVKNKEEIIKSNHKQENINIQEESSASINSSQINIETSININSSLEKNNTLPDQASAVAKSKIKIKTK